MKKILIIDDEEWLREMMRLALAAKGFNVFEAENGETGIQIARKELPDIILCDVNMKKVDGYLTLSALRNEPATAAIPFILMTGMADTPGMRHGMELGADDYLPKPFTLDGLFAAVDARIKKIQAFREEAEKKLSDLRDNIGLMLPHELRTPLNGILAYGEILKTDAPTLSAREIAEMGQVIHESGRRLQRLVENFLIYAQIELMAGDPSKARSFRSTKTARPAGIIQSCAQTQAEAARRLGDLSLDLIDRPVAMSEEFLQKVADELIGNAFKFSKPGTPVHVSSAASAKTVSLSVADHGRGLTPEEIAWVGAYMQFHRKVQEQQGLGLGLIISKRLAELHGGALTIHSELGKGATVVVSLPAAQ